MLSLAEQPFFQSWHPFFVFLWFFDCVFFAMTTDELQCNECGVWFLDRVGLKNHKTALHVNEILVGESKFPVHCHCMHSFLMDFEK